MGKNIISKRKVVPILVVYIFTVLWYTLINRATGYRGIRNELFWSYKACLAGNKSYGYEIVANMVMFMPYGFLVAGYFSHKSTPKWSFLAIGLCSVGFSSLIELLQYVLLRGLFEWDDIISNVIGASIGVLCYRGLDKVFSRKMIYVYDVLCLCFLVCCGFVYVNPPNAELLMKFDNFKEYCFQVDGVEYDSETNEMYFRGFVFRYNEKNNFVDLTLRSTTTRNKIKLDVEYGIERKDVNEYFCCEYDYTYTGFIASVQAEKVVGDEEYEIMIEWPMMISVPTGVYIRHGQLFYVSEENTYDLESKGSDLDWVLQKGILLISRPDCHCYIYQIDNYLYWVTDKGFNFEDDGTTFIQYQLTTTQVNNLPKKRIENGWYWDNIGGVFEKYELKGDFGDCRIMRRKIPDAYAVKSIVTGYYTPEGWVWKEYFRPIYIFRFPCS